METNQRAHPYELGKAFRLALLQGRALDYRLGAMEDVSKRGRFYKITVTRPGKGTVTNAILEAMARVSEEFYSALELEVMSRSLSVSILVKDDGESAYTEGLFWVWFPAA